MALSDFIVQFKALTIKCFWINKRNPISFLAVNLVPLFMVIFLYVTSTSKGRGSRAASSALAAKDIFDSLCVRSYCPFVFYHVNTTAGDQTDAFVENVMNTVKDIPALKLRNVQKLATAEELHQKYADFKNKSLIAPSTPPDLYIQFLPGDNNSVSFGFPFPDYVTDREGGGMAHRFVAVLYSVAANAGLSQAPSSSIPPQERFKVRMESLTANGVAQIFDIMMVFNQITASLSLIYLVVAIRTISERQQGVLSLLRQWNVSDIVYVLTHFLSYLVFPLISASLATTGLAFLGKDINGLSFMSTETLFLLCLVIGVLCVVRGLVAGLLFSSTFVVVSLIFMFMCEILFGVILFALKLSKGLLVLLFLLFPFLNVSNYVMLLQRSTSKTFNESSEPLSRNELIGLQIASMVVHILLAIVLKIVRSSLESRSLLNIIRGARSFNSSTGSKQLNFEEGLAIDKVTKTYKKRAVVSDVSLSATCGRVYAFLGKNGAGKSTLMKMMSGNLEPSSGTLRLFGHNICGNKALMNGYVAYCAQENQYWADLTLGQHVQFFGMLMKKDDMDVHNELSRVGLELSQDSLARDLSGGMKRRLNLVLCGIRRSKLILLDEPTSGVDHITQWKIWKFIEQLKEGAIVILATHYMEEAHVLCDQLVIIQEGKLFCDGTPRELKQQYGELLQVRIDVKEHYTAQVKSLISQHVPDVTVVDVAKGNFKISFTEQEIPGVATFLHHAKSVPEFNWQFTNHIVEHIFNQVYQAEQEPSTPNESLPAALPTPAASSSAMAQNKQLPRVQDSRQLFLNQTKASFSKNLRLLMRNRKSTFGSIALFVVLLAFPQVFVKFPKTSNRPTFMNVTAFEMSMAVTFSGYDFSETALQDTSLLNAAGIDVSNRLEGKKLDAELEKEGKKEQKGVACGFRINAFKPNQLDYTVLYEPSPISVAACVDFITTLYASSLKQRNATASSKLSMGSLNESFQSQLFGMISMLIGVLQYGFAAIILLLAGKFIIYEKVRGMDYALRFQGMRSAPLWAGTLLFHLVLVLFVVIVIAVYGLATDLRNFMAIHAVLLGFFAVGIFLSGLTHIFTFFISGDAHFMLYSMVMVYILNNYLTNDNAPWVYLSSFSLFSRISTSALLGLPSMENTWLPCIVLVVYGIALTALTIFLDSIRRTSESFFSSLFRRNKKPFQDAEGLAMQRLDDSTKREISDIQNGEKTLEHHSLVLNDVSKQFGKKTVLSDMYMALEQRECYGLLGPNGAGESHCVLFCFIITSHTLSSGKSTIINMILGILQPSSGTIQMRADKGNLSVGYCPQFGYVWPEFTVYEHLCITAMIRGAVSGTEHDWALDMAARVGLDSTSSLKTTPYNLSGGMRRRLCLAIALMGDPDILILDEPTAGVDPLNRENIWRIIQQYREHKADEPASILLTTHHLDEADTLCDRIGIMKEGRLQCIAPQEELKATYASGYSLLLLVDMNMTVESIEHVEKAQTVLEQAKLTELNEVILKTMNIPSKGPNGEPVTLYTPKAVSRRRIVTSKGPEGSRLSWKLYVRFSVPKSHFHFASLQPLLVQFLSRNVEEWKVGTAELEEVFVNVLL
jgi:ABC-type multidrug transport system ATPase subunit